MKLPNIFKRKRSIARRLTWRVILTVTLVFAIRLYFRCSLVCRKRSPSRIYDEGNGCHQRENQ